jgi:hypothetical protein
VTCMLAPFFLALCCVPDLKYLIPFSLVSNLVGRRLTPALATSYSINRANGTCMLVFTSPPLLVPASFTPAPSGAAVGLCDDLSRGLGECTPLGFPDTLGGRLSWSHHLVRLP